MDTIRCGIIGTGVAARLLHSPALSALSPRYSIQALCNRTIAKAESMAQEIGLDRKNVYSDYRRLLERTDIDAVILALPPRLNYAAAKAAMESDKHVICEKPIAAALSDGQKMKRLPEQFGKKLLIAENFRYEKAIQECRTVINADEVGNPVTMIYTWMQHVPVDDEIAVRPWRRDSGLPGGFLSDHGIHMFDVARYLFGEISEVHVFGSDTARHVVGIDSASINLRFSSGTAGTIQWSFAVPISDFFTLKVFGSKGTLHLSQDVLELQTVHDSKTISFAGRETSFYYEFLDFYHAITENRDPVMTVDDAMRDLEAVHGAYKSVRSGRTIHL